MLEHVYRLFQQLNSLLIRSVAIPLQINQPSFIATPQSPLYTFYTFYTAQTLSPCRRTIGGNDSLAALKRLGNDEPEVVGERRENEHIAPVPDFLELFAKGGGDDF